MALSFEVKVKVKIKVEVKRFSTLTCERSERKP